MFAFGLQLGLFFCKKGTLGSSRTTWSEPHHLLFRAKKEDIRRFHGVILVFSFLLSIPSQIIQESMMGTTFLLFGSGKYFNCNNEHKEHHKHKNDILHILPFSVLSLLTSNATTSQSRTCWVIFSMSKRNLFPGTDVEAPQTTHPPQTPMPHWRIINT